MLFRGLERWGKVAILVSYALGAVLQGWMFGTFAAHSYEGHGGRWDVLGLIGASFALPGMISLFAIYLRIYFREVEADRADQGDDGGIGT